MCVIALFTERYHVILKVLCLTGFDWAPFFTLLFYNDAKHRDKLPPANERLCFYTCLSFCSQGGVSRPRPRPRGVSMARPGECLPRGVSKAQAWGGVYPSMDWGKHHPDGVTEVKSGKERAVRVLLECILVYFLLILKVKIKTNKGDRVLLEYTYMPTNNNNLKSNGSGRICHLCRVSIDYGEKFNYSFVFFRFRSEPVHENEEYMSAEEVPGPYRLPIIGSAWKYIPFSKYTDYRSSIPSTSTYPWLGTDYRSSIPSTSTYPWLGSHYRSSIITG